MLFGPFHVFPIFGPTVLLSIFGPLRFFLSLDHFLGSPYLVRFELSFIWPKLFAFFFWSIVDFYQIGPKGCLFGLGPILFFIIWTKQVPGDPGLYCKTGMNSKQA